MSATKLNCRGFVKIFQCEICSNENQQSERLNYLPNMIILQNITNHANKRNVVIITQAKMTVRFHNTLLLFSTQASQHHTKAKKNNFLKKQPSKFVSESLGGMPSLSPQYYFVIQVSFQGFQPKKSYPNKQK